MLEKELKYLLRHPLMAVLALVVPAIAAVVGWWALPFLSNPFWRAIPLFGFALYALLVTQAVWLNAFGWDRGGARLWFLAPIDLADVLRAKNAASRVLAFGLFALSAAAIVATGGVPPAGAVVAALVLHLGAGAWWVTAGNLVSILNPRPGSHSLQRGASLSPISALVGMGIISGVVGLFLLPILLAWPLSDRPWPFLVASWAALGLAGAAVRRAALPFTVRLLARRREDVIGAVAGDDV
jgi:ABC-2 type transport system permease protein